MWQIKEMMRENMKKNQSMIIHGINDTFYRDTVSNPDTAKSSHLEVYDVADDDSEFERNVADDDSEFERNNAAGYWDVDRK